MSELRGIPYNELEVGQQATFSKQLTERDVVLFGETSGDVNPVHYDQDYAESTMFKGRIAHGMWTAGIISTALGTVLPGSGSIYMGQEMKFLRPVRLNDMLTVQLTILEKVDKRKSVVVETKVVNQDDELVVTGQATIMPPRKPVLVEAPALPEVTVEGLD